MRVSDSIGGNTSSVSDADTNPFTMPQSTRDPICTAVHPPTMPRAQAAARYPRPTTNTAT